MYLSGFLAISVGSLSFQLCFSFQRDWLTLIFPQAPHTLLQASYVTQQPNFSLFVQANGMSAVWYLTALNWAIVLVSTSKLLVPIGNIQRLVPKCQQLPGSHYLQKHSTSLCQSLIIKVLTATNLLLMNFSTFMCFHFCLDQLILNTTTGKFKIIKKVVFY